MNPCSRNNVLPIHCPADGRVMDAPIPAPTEANTSEAQHPTLALDTFRPRILTCLAVSTESMPCLALDTEEKN